MIRLPLELIRQFKVEEGHEIYAAHVIDNSNSLLGYVLVGGKTKTESILRYQILSIQLISLFDLKILFSTSIESSECLGLIPARRLAVRNDVVCAQLYDKYTEIVHTSNHKEMDLIIMSILWSYNYSHWFWSIFHGYQQSNQERIKESKLVTALDKGRQNAYKKLLPLLAIST
jgi:hypothetical protein